MSDLPLRVGLVGLGKMGQNHLRVLSMLRGVELAFLADSDLSLAERLGASYGIPALEDLSQATGPADAIIICTPTVTHANFVRLSSTTVRNIFVEKPLAGTLAEAEEIAAFSAENGLNIQVGFIERFNPAVQEAQVDSGSRGTSGQHRLHTH
ncbi:Gfo/Idh/MocA family oxidoreductase [Devosia algicola]|uniref:Gfo/Idh/MocA family oxidoreductase n=1 Tax=Devosia algicola TaxID=3026418 RepID=A0ABY7YMC9_9HYPH|nr:Gfo/Idh/MocA family oxidoreductase [Devosia algicola]WDR02338.1 Gfo/Idh/MocA family oxidoreductase [Devosia algicola]